MIEGKTKSGFDFQISETVKDDIELFFLIGDLSDDENDEGKLINIYNKIAIKILGKKQYLKLISFLKKKSERKDMEGNGVISILTFREEIESIFNSINEIKN